MRSQLRNKASLLSRVSTLAILAAAGTLGAVQQAEAACDTTWFVPEDGTTITTNSTCVVVDEPVEGDVVNQALIGDPGTGFIPFFVGADIDGSLINNGNIFGGYFDGKSQRGALTIGSFATIADGIVNNLAITSTGGNGIQIGTGGESAGFIEGGILNTDDISSGARYGIAAIEGSLSGGLTNTTNATISGGLAAVFVADTFGTWSGNIDNSGQISGFNAAIQLGDGDAEEASIVFDGAIINNFSGEIDSSNGPAIFVTNDVATFTGGIQNFGRIEGAFDAIVIEAASFSGGLYNDAFATIVASTGTAVDVNGSNWSGDVVNNGRIQGGPEGSGFGFQSGNYTGNFSNAGSIDGGFAGVVISTEGTIQGAGGEGNTAEFRNTGSITGGSTGLKVAGGIVVANFTNTSADPGFLPPGYISAESGAAVVLYASESWTGNITNTGTISGLVGVVVGGIPSSEGLLVSEGSFEGAITNNGVIEGDITGLHIVGASVEGSLSNTGSIVGASSGGVIVEVDRWTGDITNSGYIEGGFVGMRVTAFDTFEGSITNNGTIVGGTEFQFEEFAVAFDPGLVVSASNFIGDITNNGTLSASSRALIVDVGNLQGTVTNTGLIEATGGGPAVLFEVGNGATFVNTGGGTIHGDVIFGGKAPYDFIAENGGIEGSLVGVDDGGGNDDVVTVQDGTHYFVFEGKSGAARNFAEFNVEDGGTALMGARYIGDTAGTGYGFSNVDALNVNNGGQLYIDKRTQLDVGTYAQQAGGTTTFFLAAPADGGEFAIAATAATPGVDYGQIIASGQVSLNGTIAAVFDPLSFAGTGLNEIEYNDVIVGDSLVGDFNDDQIFGNSYFFSLSHVLDGNTVDLLVSRNGFNNVPCRNSNNDSFGSALETIFNSGGPINQNLFQYLSGLSESDVCSAYDDIGGTVLADLGAVVVETAGPWKNMVNDRLNGIGSGSCGLAGPGWCFNRFAENQAGGQVMTDATPGDDPFNWLRTGVRRVGETAAWGRLIGVWGDTNGSGGVAGTDFQISGAIVGVDHVFTPVLLAGVAAQWTSNEIDFDGRRDNADVDSFEFGAYASYGDTRFYVNANASFIWHDFGVHRTVLGQSAIGDYDGTTFSAYVEAGKIFEAGQWRIQPLAALSYAHLETDDYREVGSAIDLLNVKGTEFDSFKGMLGARVAYPIEMKSGRKMVPEARVVWAHEFMDDHSTFTAALQSAPNVPFIVKGQNYSRDTLIVGTGLTAPISDATSLFVDYDAGINPDITTHTVSVGFRMRW
jgi:outer membrane autotransporter protein